MAHRARWRPRPAARRGRGRLVAESATAVLDRSNTRTRVNEANAGVLEAPRNDGLIPIVLIRAGWSLNGNYWPADVLRRDAATAWPAGTLSFVDHQTAEEDEARPAGSMTKLAGFLPEAARWDEKRQAVVGMLRPFALWRDAVLDWAKSGAVGMSIRAYVDARQGEAEGRRGEIIERIHPGGGINSSVDIVTVPAAGGRLGVAESVGAKAKRVGEARNIGVWLESRLHLELTTLADDLYGNGRLTRQERIVLSSAIGDALRVWAERVEADAPQLFQRDIWDDAPDEGEVRADEAVLRRPVAEATSEEIRRALCAALRQQYASENVYVWLYDYDADRRLLWYEQATRDGESSTYQQGYSIGEDGRVTLAEERIVVVARTVYEPVESPATVPTGETVTKPALSTSDSAVSSRPVVEDVRPADSGAGLTTPSTKGREATVDGPQTGATPDIGGAAEPARTIEASETAVQALARLHAALAESQKANEALKAENANLKLTIARLEARDYARDKVTAALEASSLTKSSYKVVLTAILDTVEAWTDEHGRPDETKLQGAIAGEIAAEEVRVAKLLEEKGVGKVSGLGAGDGMGEDTAEAWEQQEIERFMRMGMTREAAERAVRGRD